MDQSPQVAAYQDNPLRRDKKRGQASFLGALMVAPRFLKVDSIPSATARRKGDIRNFAARGGPLYLSSSFSLTCIDQTYQKK